MTFPVERRRVGALSVRKRGSQPLSERICPVTAGSQEWFRVKRRLRAARRDVDASERTTDESSLGTGMYGVWAVAWIRPARAGYVGMAAHRPWQRAFPVKPHRILGLREDGTDGAPLSP